MNTVGALNEETRVEWLSRTLAAVPAGSRLLDAGAGEREYKRFCAHLNYVSQDFAQYDGRGDSSGLQKGGWEQAGLDIVSDITSIPEPDASFDVIMCTEVLEHLPAPLLALGEFKRLLKPGGYLILTAPFCSLTHFAPYHFATGFNRYFYETHLPANGFDIIDIQSNGNYFDYIAQELRRLPYVAQRYAKDGLHWWEKLALRISLTMLQRLTGKGQNSAELLNFGYHVLAARK